MLSGAGQDDSWQEKEGKCHKRAFYDCSQQEQYAGKSNIYLPCLGP